MRYCVISICFFVVQLDASHIFICFMVKKNEQRTLLRISNECRYYFTWIFFLSLLFLAEVLVRMNFATIPYFFLSFFRFLLSFICFIICIFVSIFDALHFGLISLTHSWKKRRKKRPNCRLACSFAWHV